MADTIQTLRLELDRAMVRIRSLEEIVFRTNPSDAADVLDSLEAIRIYLRKIESPTALSPGAVTFIRERLPVDWRMLTVKHGHGLVFPLLAHNFNIIEARRRLG